jgi:hypothetical protein
MDRKRIVLMDKLSSSTDDKVFELSLLTFALLINCHVIV